MKIQKRVIWLIGALMVIVILTMNFVPVHVQADTITNTPNAPKTPTEIPKLENPLKFGSIEGLVTGLVDIALQVGVVVAALSLIWVGFKYVAARGNPKKIEEAHQALLYTIIGIAILFGAKVIVEIIKGTIEPLAPELFKNIK